MNEVYKTTVTLVIKTNQIQNNGDEIFFISFSWTEALGLCLNRQKYRADRKQWIFLPFIQEEILKKAKVVD